MTKEEVKKLTEKVVLGTATVEEIIVYNRICDFAEAAGRDAVEISAERKEELAGALKKAIFQKAGIGKVYRMNRLRWTGVAASVLLLIALGRVLFFSNIVKTPVARNTVKKSVDSLADIRHEVNTTGKEKRIQLPDGSLIVLADKSEITYRAPFTGKRDIALAGKAYFKVSKDKLRPFTVTSGDVSTMALGTEFTVTAFEKDKTIIVRLFEGKVVINAARRMMNNVYLVPGQEFIYDRQPATKIKTFKLKKAATPEEILDEEQFRDHLAIPQNETGSWFMFNNQQLAQVLDQFAALYNVKIIYNKKDVQNIYFTGKYKRLDSLETILKRISTLNNLTITRKDNAFIISK